MATGSLSLLNDAEIERYSRQLILKGWSAKFQRMLCEQRVEDEADYPTAILYFEVAGVGTHQGSNPTWKIVRENERNFDNVILIREHAREFTIQIASSEKTLEIPQTVTDSMREPFIGSLVALELIEWWQEKWRSTGLA